VVEDELLGGGVRLGGHTRKCIEFVQAHGPSGNSKNAHNDTQGSWHRQTKTAGLPAGRVKLRLRGSIRECSLQ
jgi:hypothetical protein